MTITRSVFWNSLVSSSFVFLGALNSSSSAMQYAQPQSSDSYIQGQSVVNQLPQQSVPQNATGKAGGFLPPNVKARVETPFGSGLGDVAPRNNSPSQIQNYLKPLDESVYDQTTNGNRSSDEKQLTETTKRLELIVENYENGRPKLKRYVAQDEDGNYYNQGKWQLLGRQQEITAEGEFNRGRMDGQWKRLHAKSEGGMFSTKPFTDFEGPFRSYAEFRNGKLDGVWKITDRFDQIIFEMPYTKGVRNGTASWYHPNSEKMLEITFKMGVIDGLLFEWNDRKDIIRQEEFVEGRKIVKDTQFFAKDKPLSQNFYLDAKLEVEGEDDWWKAQPAGYASSGMRVQHGPTGTWYQNGQPQMRGQFDEGLREGLFVGWHPNGQKDVVGRFEKDVRVGKWTWWHSNGFKSVEGEFEDGVQIGEWIWWNDDGTVSKRRDLTRERTILETSERRNSEEPSDAIIDPDTDDVDPTDEQREEVQVQELPEKKSDDNANKNNDDENDIPLDVIPLTEPKTESKGPTQVDGTVEDVDPPVSDSPTTIETEDSSAEEIEANQEVDDSSTEKSNTEAPNPVTDPFDDKKSDRSAT